MQRWMEVVLLHRPSAARARQAKLESETLPLLPCFTVLPHISIPLPSIFQLTVRGTADEHHNTTGTSEMEQSLRLFPAKR